VLISGGELLRAPQLMKANEWKKQRSGGRDVIMVPAVVVATVVVVAMSWRWVCGGAKTKIPRFGRKGAPLGSRSKGGPGRREAPRDSKNESPGGAMGAAIQGVRGAGRPPGFQDEEEICARGETLCTDDGGICAQAGCSRPS